MERLGITSETLFNMKEIDGAKRVVYSEEGTEANYDLLITIPAHRGMEVIEKNELGARGFIPTHRHRLNMEGRDNVFIIGDTTNLPISKAGSTAHFEAEALGENIAAMIKIGSPVRDYDGKVFCFIEAGKDRATYAMFDYNNPPDPKPPTKPCTGSRWRITRLYWSAPRAACCKGGRAGWQTT